MNIVMAQLNAKVGAFDENLAKVEEVIASAPTESIIVFPEMMLFGYSLEDLTYETMLEYEDHKINDLIQNIVATRNPTSMVVLGSLERSPEPFKCYNSALVVTKDEVRSVAKRALPTYGVFDETRLFTPGEDGPLRVCFMGKHFAIAICEDIWQEGTGFLEKLHMAPYDGLIIINGSPFEAGKMSKRYEVMRKATDYYAGADLGVYLNLVGGQDNLVFDGGSFIIQREGNVVGRMSRFEEEVTTFDWDNLISSTENLPLDEMKREGEMYRASVLGLRDYVLKNGFKRVALGVSGGIDSALVASIANDAIGGENVLGVSMPSEFSSDHSLSDAEVLMKNMNGEYRVQPIKETFDVMMNALHLEGVAAENLQARIRGMILMSLANQEHYLILSPGNKSELATGYSTIYGDSVGGFAPIMDAYKTDVYAMSRWRNTQAFPMIPVNSIEKEPSAELSPGQKDSDSLPDYDLLDAFLKDLIENRNSRRMMDQKYGAELTGKVMRMFDRAEWKRRQYPIGPKLTKRSFGRERLVPITK